MKTFWLWLFALFGRKPKELPSPTTEVDDIFLSAFQQEKERQDEITRQEEEAKKKREQEELARKKKGVDPKHIKAAFDFAARKLAAPSFQEDILIAYSNLGGMSYQDFQAFCDSFIELCKAKGIDVFQCGPDAIKIIRPSLLEYQKRCEEARTSKPKTITTGAYR